MNWKGLAKGFDALAPVFIGFGIAQVIVLMLGAAKNPTLSGIIALICFVLLFIERICRIQAEYQKLIEKIKERTK